MRKQTDCVSTDNILKSKSLQKNFYKAEGSFCADGARFVISKSNQTYFRLQIKHTIKMIRINNKNNPIIIPIKSQSGSLSSGCCCGAGVTDVLVVVRGDVVVLIMVVDAVVVVVVTIGIVLLVKTGSVTGSVKISKQQIIFSSSKYFYIYMQSVSVYCSKTRTYISTDQTFYSVPHPFSSFWG